MSTFRGVARHPVVCCVMRTLLALCVAALVASPLLPHDPSCHIKARTDCTACTLDLASGDIRSHAAPGTTVLTAQTGAILIPSDPVPSSLALTSTTDRAPPG
jgi:hypothetical protein